MRASDIEQVRRFNRLVTRRVGALEDSYLSRGRPLGEARLVYEIGAEGAEARALRDRLGLDSGYLSRLLRSLEAQGLVTVAAARGDARRRRARLTRRGRDELAAYDSLSDELAASWLAGLDDARRGRLVAAMGEVERLLRAAAVEVAPASAAGADARRCLGAYFAELSARFEGGFEPPDLEAEVADLSPPAGFLALARLDGEAVGCGGLRRVDAATGEIKRLWTAPSARGLGVARALMRALEANARAQGFATLRLDTNKALVEAHALYRKEGWREVVRFNDNPYADHWFVKSLEATRN